MKVILLEDVKSLGKRGDVVKVSDGYARNLLLPKKLCLEATPRNLNELKLKKAHQQKLAQNSLEAARAFAQNLEEKEIMLSLKVGEGGKTFGSISAREICEAAQEQLGMTLDKKKLQLDSPIKALGPAEIPLRLHPEVTAIVKVMVREG